MTQATENAGRMKKDLPGMEVAPSLSLIVHELRNPLAVIRGYAHLLGQELPPDTVTDAVRYLNTIQLYAFVLERMIDGLMVIDQSRRGTFVIKPARVDLNQLVGVAAEASSGLAAEKHISLVYRSPNSPVEVLADENYTGRALFLMIYYLIQQTRTGSRIEIDVLQSEHVAEVIVSNQTDVDTDLQWQIMAKFTDDRPADRSADLEAMDYILLAAGYVAAAHRGGIEVARQTTGAVRGIFYLPGLLG